VEVRKTVTALFADVTGSTALGERLDPESLRAVMTRYADEMRAVVERHGGTVEKFIGDAVMAVFGVPTVHEDDALRAIRAAAEMREALATLNVELERDWGARLEVRIGVNTGEVVAGDPASGQSFVTGDTVNVAARLEQAAEPGEILLGEETQRLVRDAVIVKAVDPLELKGKAERVPAFRLLDVTPGAAAFARRLDSPLVGRDRDLARLRQTLEEAIEQRACRLATVVGDAGLGKTRLVNELVDLEGVRVRTVWARCLPYGEGITFWPIAEIVHAAAGLDEPDTAEEARAKVRTLLEGFEDGVEVADRVSAAIGLGGEGGGEIQETFWAVRRLLEALARERPLVVIVEDVHWAEPTLLDLVQYVAGFSADHSILVLCSSRPSIRETRPDWERSGVVVGLEPLTEGECELLIENLLGQTGLAEAVRARITDAAEGNPLFVEEMLRMLIDDGTLERTNGHWTARGDLSRVAVPATITALLSARLDQLEPGERAVIQRASVVGKVFWWGAVAELSPEADRPLVGSHLQALLRKELVRPDRSGFAGEDSFRFSHILVRDAAYESLPKRARSELHERFAAWLQDRAGARVTEFEEILGYHLEQASRYRAELGPADERAIGLAERAAALLVSAGRRALARWDISAAVNLLSRAVDLLPVGDPRRPDVLVDLGAAMARTDLRRAHEILGRAMAEARAAGEPRLEARAGLRRIPVHILLDPEADQAESLREAETYLERFEEWHDEPGLGEARSIVGTIRFWQGRMALGMEQLRLAVAHARRAGDRRQEAESIKWLGLGIVEGPTPVEEGLRQLDELARDASPDLRIEAFLDRDRSALEAMRGRFEEARRLVGRSKQRAREVGDRVALVSALRYAGGVEILAGMWAAAETELREACELCEEIDDIGHLSSIAPDLGEALYRQGRHAEALAQAELSERITIAGDVDADVRWRTVRGLALAGLGRIDEAIASATAAVEESRPTEYFDLRAESLLGLAEVLKLGGRGADAAAAIEEALELCRVKGDLVDERRALAMLAELRD
jgi:class 3 adenylate cyclase/tetratricopeptide (TPR) repeat protein